ncbi:MAG: hypothetical protein ACE5J4_00590 [Candidatus Aenigmatarchaeota archaeon]
MNYKVYAIITGIFFGTGALLIKVFLNDSYWFILLLALILGLTGYGFLQFALKKGRGNITLVLALGISSVIAILGGIFLLSEILSLLEITGVILILLGLILLKFKKRFINIF